MNISVVGLYYMALRISMILYKTFLFGVGVLNLHCCL